MKTPESLAIGRLLGWTALLATLIVMPWTAYDPINVPKLAVISVGGFMALGALLANRVELFKKQYRIVLIITVAFITQLTLVLLFSGTNFYQEFFGTFGRATGYVAYAVLAFLLLAAVVSASSFALSRFTWFLMAAGLISIVYGVIQALKLDPINWVNQYSPVMGFLGNPNFQSSFLGFSGVMAFALLIGKKVKILIRGGYSVYLLAAAYVIKETASQQGFLVLMGGIGVVLLVWINTSRFKLLTIPTLIAGFAGVVLVTLGSLNSGPLASVLYKASVTYRGDYWRAGWKMTTEHPLFGIGLDSYGDWYRRARTVEATLRRGPEVASNAAHNVLLDFSSNGGFPLAIIYLFMMFLVVVASFKVLRRGLVFDPIFTGLVAVWVAYQAQSIISLNQLGLAVWGWIISGLIIGYEINTRPEALPNSSTDLPKKGRSTSDRFHSKIGPNSLVGMCIGLIIGLLIGLQPLLASTKIRSALESGNAQVVEQAAKIWPAYPIHIAQVVRLLQQNNLEAQALKIVTEAVEKFPDEFGLWNLLEGMSSATSEQRAQAKSEMKRLDPNNPNLR